MKTLEEFEQQLSELRDLLVQVKERIVERLIALRKRITRSVEAVAHPPEMTFSGFGFENAQDSGRCIGTWCCPHCGGDRFGSDDGAARRQESFSYAAYLRPSQELTWHCTGSIDNAGPVSSGCGYWETATSPRRQGLGDPVTPERW